MTSLGRYSIGTAITGTGFSLALQCLTGFFGDGMSKRSAEDEGSGQAEDNNFTHL
jgi:hypothetical protein